jgi:hypothetical protein
MRATPEPEDESNGFGRRRKMKRPAESGVHRILKFLHDFAPPCYNDPRAQLGVGIKMDEASAISYEPGTLCFRYNVCGEQCQTALDPLGREEVSCKGCGSSPGARAIIRLLSTEPFSKNFLLSGFPARPDIRGLGMTDWKGYAERLAEKFS